jgi:hypothetical protein
MSLYPQHMSCALPKRGIRIGRINAVMLAVVVIAVHALGNRAARRTHA